VTTGAHFVDASVRRPRGSAAQALIAREPTERRPTIRGWLPPGFLPPQVTIASATPSVETIRAHVLDPNMMVSRRSADDVLFWRNDLI